MAKKPKICPYCKKPAKWVSNEVIYGQKYGESYMIWHCKPCDAYVGCHQNTKKSLGSMANAELRRARKLTKERFIKIYLRGNWNCKKMLKDMAYQTLAERMGIHPENCHFAMFRMEHCRLAWKVIHNLPIEEGDLIKTKHGKQRKKREFV